MKFRFFIALLMTAMIAQGSPLLKKVKERTGFEEHSYELIKGSEKECQGDVLLLKYEESGDNAVIRLGEKFIFADLDNGEFSNHEEPGCIFKVTNQISQKNITQVMSHTCKKKTENYESTQSLRLQDNQLSYSYERKSKTKSQNTKFTCVFKQSKTEVE